MKLTRVKEIEEAARRIIAMGAESVVIKGGHRKGPAIDLFFDGKKIRTLRSPRIRTRHTHGTGCTFSAAIAAYLAKGEKIEDAVVLAKTYHPGDPQRLRRRFGSQSRTPLPSLLEELKMEDGG